MKSDIIVDLGAGVNFYQKATDVVDFVDRGCYPDSIQKHIFDFTRNPLPFEKVDFLYSRHTLEDLLDPWFVCTEIARVAKAGYIETPSPALELAHKIDGVQPATWKGYIHHRSIFWIENDTLMILPKYAVLEYVDLSEYILPNVDRDTKFYFSGNFKFHCLRHEQEFDLRYNYIDWVKRALSGQTQNEGVL